MVERKSSNRLTGAARFPAVMKMTPTSTWSMSQPVNENLNGSNTNDPSVSMLDTRPSFSSGTLTGPLQYIFIKNTFTGEKSLRRGIKKALQYWRAF